MESFFFVLTNLRRHLFVNTNTDTGQAIVSEINRMKLAHKLNRITRNLSRSLGIIIRGHYFSNHVLICHRLRRSPSQ